jgi:hypothetical protein
MQEVPHVPGAQVPRQTPGYAAAHSNEYADQRNYQISDNMSDGKKSDPELAPVDKTATVQVWDGSVSPSA